MKLLTSWPVPLFMAGLFAVLISTSDASPAGIAAAGVGLALVLLFWSLFREGWVHAELSRALSIGDGAAAAALAEVQLQRRAGKRRAPFVVYRAMAHELLGEWAEIEALLGGAEPLAFAGGAAAWRLSAASVRVAALAERGQVDAARALFDAEVQPRLRALGERGSAPATLSEGRLRLAEGDLGGAEATLRPLIRNIRLGPAQRAMASHYLARVAERAGRSAEAAELRKQAAALAPLRWLAASPS
jgi:hypothetical protein